MFTYRFYTVLYFKHSKLKLCKNCNYKGYCDRDGFVCVENEIEDTTKRPEGYHYKAHYQIKVREFGSMRQGSHRDIKISSCRPKQANGMLIEVVSSLRSGVNSGDIVFVLNGPLF